jgi:hypothetical protein
VRVMRRWPRTSPALLLPFAAAPRGWSRRYTIPNRARPGCTCVLVTTLPWLPQRAGPAVVMNRLPAGSAVGTCDKAIQTNSVCRLLPVKRPLVAAHRTTHRSRSVV